MGDGPLVVAGRRLPDAAACAADRAASACRGRYANSLAHAPAAAHNNAQPDAISLAFAYHHANANAATSGAAG